MSAAVPLHPAACGPLLGGDVESLDGLRGVRGGGGGTIGGGKQASGAGRARGTPFRIHLDRQLSLICRPAEPDSAESPAASSAVIMLVSPFFS